MNEATTAPPTAAFELMSRLANETPNGRAREAALRAAPLAIEKSTSLVEYRSSGELLIIDQFKSVGDEERALHLANELGDRLSCTVLISGLASTGVKEDAEPALAARGVRVAVGRLAQLTGYLGNFAADLSTPSGPVKLTQHLGMAKQHFDLVLDLTVPAHFRQETLPLGYYAPGRDTMALTRALDELPDLMGEFEKPKYFAYNPDICAHGGSGLIGCRRCLDACPTLAIGSLGDSIEVNPYLCQGAGVCATACPSGAITYAYPSTSDLLDGLRAMLKAYRQTGGRHACILFHDREKSKALLERIAARLPEQVIPVEVEEAGSVGLDTWLATLAYGACQVAVLGAGATPSVLNELRAQHAYATAILEGMGYPAEQLQLIDSEDDDAVLETLAKLPEFSPPRPAGFAGLDEKRTTIRLAVDHLHAHAPAPTAVATLPRGAPFGEIEVDGSGCTLCMACASICPHAALSDGGGELPQLLFDEWNCVQCGLCETACPEDVITLVPRFLYDAEMRRATRTLNEAEPFCCVSCGKPFATKNMMAKMQAKLKGHWMYQKAETRRRMEMCDECRVKDMLMQEGGLMDAHKEP
ncbi:MAG: 4Fe-4S binding protein [Gammaproteobacteria bacterium]|nr:4Fe-4S binding protein [Gammaproteobacteria bacterium]